MMGTTEHVFDHGYDRDGGLFAACSCGWESKSTFDFLGAAEEAWNDHCDVVFMESTMTRAASESNRGDA